MSDHIEKRVIYWSQAAMLLVSLLLIVFVNNDLTLLSSLNPRANVDWWCTVGVGFVLAIVSYAILFGLILQIKPMQEAFQPDMNRLVEIAGQFSLSDILLISILAGLSEELLFRAFLQAEISNISSPRIGLIAASLLFGLAHLVSIYYFVATFIIGLSFGLVYQFTDSILLVIVWHSVYDCIALYMMRYHSDIFAQKISI